jgi:dTDP-4-dehydrorhamnose reductase
MSAYVVLVFGHTPMAHRLEYYLKAYATEREYPMVVYRSGISTMEALQERVWSTYVSGSHEGRPAVLINASELNDLDICETNPKRAWRENTRDAAYVAYAARTANLPLIHLSTDHVFRGESGPYLDTKIPANPLNVYGVTKWYAERIIESIHPYQHTEPAKEKGTRIIRTSGLYGFDVHSIPAKLTPGGDSVTRQGKPVEVTTGGVIRDGTRTTPSFIGEVAFLIARNLVHNSGFGQRIIHIAPDIPNTTWADYLQAIGQNVLYTKSPPHKGDVRLGASRGLKPSAGWYLPTDPRKSFGEFHDEYIDGAYTRYWA